MNYSDLSLPIFILAPQVEWEERMLPHSAGVWLQSLWTEGRVERPTANSPGPAQTLLVPPR